MAPPTSSQMEAASSSSATSSNKSACARRAHGFAVARSMSSESSWGTPSHAAVPNQAPSTCWCSSGLANMSCNHLSRRTRNSTAQEGNSQARNTPAVSNDLVPPEVVHDARPQRARRASPPNAPSSFASSIGVSKKGSQHDSNELCTKHWKTHLRHLKGMPGVMKNLFIEK